MFWNRFPRQTRILAWLSRGRLLNWYPKGPVALPGEGQMENVWLSVHPATQA